MDKKNDEDSSKTSLKENASSKENATSGEQGTVRRMDMPFPGQTKDVDAFSDEDRFAETRRKRIVLAPKQLMSLIDSSTGKIDLTKLSGGGGSTRKINLVERHPRNIPKAQHKVHVRTDRKSVV